jgi:hypothetical protein
MGNTAKETESMEQPCHPSYVLDAMRGVKETKARWTPANNGKCDDVSRLKPSTNDPAFGIEWPR